MFSEALTDINIWKHIISAIALAVFEEKSNWKNYALEKGEVAQFM